ncbi:hypothetical protein AHAS_Ahas20G0119600 [Arachis hypogaea]
MEGFAADFGLYGNSTSGFASSQLDWLFLSSAHNLRHAKHRDKSKTVGLEAESKAVAQDCGKDPSIDVKTVTSTTKNSGVFHFKSLTKIGDTKPDKTSSKSKRRSTSKQKGIHKDTPIDVPNYNLDHLAFRRSRRKRKTSSTGTPKQIISGENDKLKRTLFSDKDRAKDKKERTPQANKIGPSRPASHIGERPYVDLLCRDLTQTKQK